MDIAAFCHIDAKYDAKYDASEKSVVNYILVIQYHGIYFKASFDIWKFCFRDTAENSLRCATLINKFKLLLFIYY